MDTLQTASLSRMSAVAQMATTEVAIDARAVSYDFGAGETRTQVLFDIDFQIGRGEVVILTGPSGSGKTTLLTLIGGLRKIQRGSLIVMGREMATLHDAGRNALRREMGFIFQHHNLFTSLTALQNVLMAAALRPGTTAEMNERSVQILTELGLGDRLHRLPSLLSGGQRQRVAIARALVNRPALVLADEPTAALDALAGETVMQLFRRLAEGPEQTTILIVTHDQRVLTHAHRIVNLVGGRIVSNVVPDLSIRICKLLRKIPAFQVFSAPTLTKFADAMETETHPPGGAIVLEGKAKGFFYLIGEGTVDVRKDDVLDRELGPGQYFYSQIPSLPLGQHAETAMAKTRTELYVLSQESFEDLIATSKEFSEQVRLHLMSRQ